MNNEYKKIFWIASYPKSGNTWIRSIVASLFFSSKGVFKFDLLNNISYFDIHEAYKFVKYIDAADYKKLNDISVIAKYWVEAQKRAEVGGNFAFFKTHSANLAIKKFNFTVPETTRGLIYMVRDPRDVAISWARHQNKDQDTTIDEMINKNTISRTSDSYKGIPEYICRWDQHYMSWERLDVPKLIIKYEDLLHNTKKILNNIVIFFTKKYNFQINNQELIVNNILESTQFKKLQKNEKDYGFAESFGKTFFKQGKANRWKKILNKNQIYKIEKEFGAIMEKLDYL